MGLGVYEISVGTVRKEEGLNFSEGGGWGLGLAVILTETMNFFI